MPKTIGIIAIKGGVGKTTIAAALATSLSTYYKKKVLLVDANYSAPNLGLHMDIITPEKTIHEVLDGKTRIDKAIHNKFGVDVIPGAYSYQNQLNYLKLKDRIKKIKDQYDFVIIDSSPNLNEEILSTMLASDSLFVVSTPDYPTLYCSLSATKFAKQRETPIAGIILNKIREPKYEITLKEMEQATEIPVVARIPDDKLTSRSVFTRIPTTIYKKNSKFAKEINKLAAAITNNKEPRSLMRKLIPIDFRREETNRQILKQDFYTRNFATTRLEKEEKSEEQND